MARSGLRKLLRQSLASPLLDTSIEGATGVLFNVSGGDDLTLLEINRAAQLIGDAVNPEAEKIFGVVTDPKLNGEIRITLIATGLGSDPVARALSKEHRKLHVEQAQEVQTAPRCPAERRDSIWMSPTFLRRRGNKVKEQTFG